MSQKIIRLIVKLRRVQKHGAQLINISTQHDKKTIEFPFNDVNYSHLNALLGHRVLMFAHATIDKEKKTLNVIYEAPYQTW